MKVILYLLLAIPFPVFSQTIICGKVIDEQTNEPVPYASVYINGTTFGTETNITGSFSLKNVIFPCELIISHISYIIKPVLLSGHGDNLLIKLTQKKIVIEEVDVKGKNYREQNFQTFWIRFIGNDIWGQYANVLNDSALVFKRTYKKQSMIIPDKNNIQNVILNESYLNDFKLSEDSSYYTYSKENDFIVQSKAPVLIQLPLLGYTLQLDLVCAATQRTDTINYWKMIGYYYFRPMSPKNKREEKWFNINRKFVYYNSSIHFCRSLYSNTLDLNGYRIFSKEKSGSEMVQYPILLDSCIISLSNNMKGIVGLKDKSFIIHYYPESTGEPKVILEPKNDKYIESEVFFLSDTCCIRSDGTLPDLSIMFKGSIGDKKIGTMLPGDFVPEEKIKNLTKKSY